jgi:hypothetical protein
MFRQSDSSIVRWSIHQVSQIMLRESDGQIVRFTICVWKLLETLLYLRSLNTVILRFAVRLLSLTHRQWSPGKTRILPVTWYTNWPMALRFADWFAFYGSQVHVLSKPSKKGAFVHFVFIKMFTQWWTAFKAWVMSTAYDIQLNIIIECGQPDGICWWGVLNGIT